MANFRVWSGGGNAWNILQKRVGSCRKVGVLRGVPTISPRITRAQSEGPKNKR